MPQNPSDAVKPITDVAKNAYHAVTSAFGLDDEGEDPKKKKTVTPPGPTATDNANATFAADPDHQSPATKASFMSKAMNKKPTPVPASSYGSARNRYGSTAKK